MKRALLLALSSLIFTNCASLNSVSLTSIPTNRKNAVSAEARKTIFLGFNFDNDFVDEVVEDLNKKCPNGKISGILTKDENYMYFLIFVWQKRITATGYCVPTTNANKEDNNSFKRASSQPTES